jgi:DNA-binding transcriptional ArsR family regulator
MPAAGDLELATVLEALGDPVRLQIVAAVAPGERPCGSFPLPVADSTRSHHLRILREAGVTQTRVSGTQRLVSLRRVDLEQRFPGLLDSVLDASAPLTAQRSPRMSNRLRDETSSSDAQARRKSRG